MTGPPDTAGSDQSASLHDYVTRAADCDPGALAVRGPDGALTYGDLDRLADQQAAVLRAAGVGPGDRVLLWCAKSVLAVAATQAVLRLGAAYVPVTETNPLRRVAGIATDCAAAAICVLGTTAERARAAVDVPVPAPIIDLDQISAFSTEPSARITHVSAPDDIAYILYTSGSTGAPKGVCLSHRNAIAFVEWAGSEVSVTAADRLSNHAPLNFDLSVFDLYAAFRAGASVHLVPAELAYLPGQLVEFIRDRAITVWYSVPSAVVLMLRDGGLLDDGRADTLRVCVVAGEVMAIKAAIELRRARPDLQIFNWYGPTETNVCTSYAMTHLDLDRVQPLPIGIAASGDVIALDPAGEGEIVVSGPTVMLGYWGAPPQLGPYRTGDIARRGPDGNLEYVGRRDHMVKVRGHRVEPGEVEGVIDRHPDVARVAVVVTGSGIEVVLHAVVVAAGERRPGLLALKKWSAQFLPTYMIVDAVHVVDDLPRTPNGKVDRSALVAAIEGGTL